QTLKAYPGDLMILTLKRDGTRLFFEREMFDKGPEKIAGQTLGPWTASVLRNNINGKGDLVRQLVTLEEESAEFKGKAVLQQKVPGFVWLEVKAKDSRPLGLLSWHRDYVYPAPAWSVNVHGAWPFQGNRPVPVDLQVW